MYLARRAQLQSQQAEVVRAPTGSELIESNPLPWSRLVSRSIECREKHRGRSLKSGNAARALARAFTNFHRTKQNNSKGYDIDVAVEAVRIEPVSDLVFA
jgi:hypothetical protein